MTATRKLDVMTRNRLHAAYIGIVPLNWRYEPGDKEQFLSRIAAIGFEGIQISPSQAQDPDFLTQLRGVGMVSAEIYVPIRCDVNGVLPGEDGETQKIIDAGKVSNTEMVVFAVDGSEDRDRVAGKAHLGPSLTENGFASLAEHIAKWARYAAEQGMRSSFHPHAATYIETPQETEALMTLLPESVGLCLDSGHWIVGGGDPVVAARHYGTRITHVHVKDVSKEVLEKMISGEYPTMTIAVDDYKLFVPAGTGLLQLEPFFTALDANGASGWLMSEQDTAWEPSEEKSKLSFSHIERALSVQ